MAFIYFLLLLPVILLFMCPPAGYWVPPQRRPSGSALWVSCQRRHSVPAAEPPAAALHPVFPRAFTCCGTMTLHWLAAHGGALSTFHLRSTFFSFQPKLNPVKCRKNVDSFLEACQRLGVPEVSPPWFIIVLWYRAGQVPRARATQVPGQHRFSESVANALWANYGCH